MKKEDMLVWGVIVFAIVVYSMIAYAQFFYEPSNLEPKREWNPLLTYDEVNESGFDYYIGIRFNQSLNDSWELQVNETKLLDAISLEYNPEWFEITLIEWKIDEIPFS